MFRKVTQTVDHLKRILPDTPVAGIVLGTGLGNLAREITGKVVIPYENIPNFPRSTVEGHAGALIAGVLEGRPVVAMQGRFHFYEGYSTPEVTFPIRVMKQLGIRALILSNASGGLNPEFAVGDMMFIEDHLNLMNLMSENPLIGAHQDEFGSRFPDMSRPYDAGLLEKAERIARSLGIDYRKGVYAGVTGPTFETPAEYRYIRFAGADAVGMSTVPEAIVAAQMNLPVFAVSVIADLGVAGKIVEISHKQVIDAASLVEPRMTRLIRELIREI